MQLKKYSSSSISSLSTPLELNHEAKTILSILRSGSGLVRVDAGQA